MNQNAISRLESLDYGKPTLTTLKRLAAAMDVGLTVRLMPFSEMIDWVSGTPRTIEGLTTGALAISCFDREEREGAFAESTHVGQIGSGAADSFVKPPQNQGAGSLGSFLSNTAQKSALRAYSSKGIANEARRPMWN